MSSWGIESMSSPTLPGTILHRYPTIKPSDRPIQVMQRGVRVSGNGVLSLVISSAGSKRAGRLAGT